MEQYYRWSAAVTFGEEFLNGKTTIYVYYHCQPYPVIKRTRAGAFIDEHGRKRFVLNDAKKKWAAPTKEEAWLNYKARSNHAIIHAQNNLNKIKAAMNTEQFKQDTPPDEIQYSTSFTFG